MQPLNNLENEGHENIPLLTVTNLEPVNIDLSNINKENKTSVLDNIKPMNFTGWIIVVWVCSFCYFVSCLITPWYYENCGSYNYIKCSKPVIPKDDSFLGSLIGITYGIFSLPLLSYCIHKLLCGKQHHNSIGTVAMCTGIMSISTFILILIYHAFLVQGLTTGFFICIPLTVFLMVDLKFLNDSFNDDDND